jgi:hypothetical protein
MASRNAHIEVIRGPRHQYEEYISSVALTTIGDCSHSVDYRSMGRTTMLWWVVCIVISAVTIPSDAWSQKSLQQLESMSQFEQALAAVDAIKHRKKLECVLSIANRTLCECLSRKLPVNTYVRGYASITNQEKEGQEYRQLSAADKKIVDQCVSDSR